VVRILQVSDSHLSPAVPYADEQWAAVVAHVRADRPDLVVHTGDISYNGAADAADLVHARRLLDELPVPWLAIPGNHDIGDFGSDAPEPVDAERRANYVGVFGATSWTRDVDAGGTTWHLIGVDVQTLLGDVPEAVGLWAWLEAQLAPGRGPTVLFIHRPLMPWAVGEIDDPHRYVTEPARSRLLGLVAAGDVRLVASGHVHQWRTNGFVDPAHVWAPPTWAVLPETIQPMLGAKLTGVVEHRLHADGTVASTLVIPAGVRRVVSGEDFPNPYAH
jgi:3',5'-cyclic-AMP phosphodiesterase